MDHCGCVACSVGRLLSLLAAARAMGVFRIASYASRVKFGAKFCSEGEFARGVVATYACSYAFLFLTGWLVAVLLRMSCVVVALVLFSLVGLGRCWV